MFTTDFIASVDKRPMTEINRRARNLRPAYVAASSRVLAELMKVFPSEGAAIGAPWPRLKEKWERRKGSSRILVWEGQLQAAFLSRLKITATQRSLMIKLPRKQVKRLAPAVIGSKFAPPRELFGWNQRMTDILIEEVIRYVGLVDRE